MSCQFDVSLVAAELAVWASVAVALLGSLGIFAGHFLWRVSVDFHDHSIVFSGATAPKMFYRRLMKARFFVFVVQHRNDSWSSATNLSNWRRHDKCLQIDGLLHSPAEGEKENVKCWIQLRIIFRRAHRCALEHSGLEVYKIDFN